jgi:hypothetical protein
LRDQLGFAAATELEVAAVDGHLDVAVRSRARVDDGPADLVRGRE